MLINNLGLLDLPYETDLLGETQIVDNEDQIIARLAKEDDPGVLIAEIDLKPKKPSMVLPDRFWIPELSQPFKQFWAHQNAVGKPLYNQAKKSGKIQSEELLSKSFYKKLPNRSEWQVYPFGLRTK